MLLISYSSLVAGKEITVSAAMSLRAPFEEIGRLFTSETGVKTVFNFGASGSLRTQIEGGAPVDVFASASEKDMNMLSDKGLLVLDTRKEFAQNKMVLAVPAGVGIKSFDELTLPSVRRIAVGNPATTPNGQYAKEALVKLGLWNKLQEKFVYAENVRQSLDYLVRGEADAGMLFITDAMLEPQKVKVVIEAPSGILKPILYPASVIKGSKNESDARAFVIYLKSPTARNVLKKYGFIIPIGG